MRWYQVARIVAFLDPLLNPIVIIVRTKHFCRLFFEKPRTIQRRILLLVQKNAEIDVVVELSPVNMVVATVLTGATTPSIIENTVVSKSSRELRSLQKLANLNR
jgi:hypothetical protein